MKKLLLASALLAASGFANAGVVSAAGGVSWEAANTASTANGGNFLTGLKFRQWYEDNTDTAVSLYDNGSLNTNIDELVGIGELTLGTDAGQPLPGNYELTFEFGGINVVKDQNGVPTGALDPVSNGYLNIYLDKDFSDNAGGYDNTSAVAGDVLNANHLADATDGDLWLGLNFASFEYTSALDPTPFIGTPIGNALGITQETGIFGNNGFAGLIGGDANFGFQVNDAAPGMAQNNFESDWTTYIGAVVDAIGFGLSSEFNVTYSEDGSGNYTGITDISTYSNASTGTVEAYTVSEPSTLAILGLGLVGFAAARRRKNA